MTIQVPFRLRRRLVAEPAVALLIGSREPAAVFEVSTRLGLDPSGRIFGVAGGFLLELAGPRTEPVPGAIRLRALAPSLYVPIDAELVPALLDDEASGLVRDWGLVFLPDGRTLLFDHQAPVELTGLVCVEPRPRRAWGSFPQGRRLADRLVQIAQELPEPPPETLYRDLKDEIGHELARPGRSGDGGRALPADGDLTGQVPSDAAEPGATEPARSAAGAGGGATSLFGSMAEGIRAMFAQAGQTWSGLKEKAQWEWVDHSHLLRRLIREFRDGDPAKALERAMPITLDDEPVAPTKAADLPWSRAIYNLSELLRLRRPNRGEATAVILGQPNLIYALTQEYRKAAERAAEQGDFRRAAYIQGFLLRDDRAAASALKRGGLHHDAAMLYMKKLNDLPAAALAFEAAGEVDRAVALYRQLGRHESAGDLLRRIGEEGAAVAEFELAAAQLAASAPADHLAAGRLLLEKARRPDQAIDQFQAGWGLRPQGNSILCALELAKILAERGAIEPIWALLEEADSLVEPFGKPFLYNELTRLAALPAMAGFADELRDRALQSLVKKLRGGLAGSLSAGAMVSALFGRAKVWPAAVVSDAEFAAGAELKRASARSSAARRDPRIAGVRIGRGTVTAAGQARVKSELFLGFDSGQVLAYRPARDEVVRVAEDLGGVTGLAVDPEGTTVAVVHKSRGQAVMSCFRKHHDGSFRPRAEAHFSASPDCWLTPILPWGVERLVGFFDGQNLVIVDAASGMLWQRRRICEDGGPAPSAAVLLPTGSSSSPPESRLVVFTHDGPSWVVLDGDGHRLAPSPYRWQPAVPVSSSLKSVPLSCRYVPPLLELLGLDKNGAIHGARFHAEEGLIELLSAQVATTRGGYLAAARSGLSMVVAVAPGRIDWLECGGERFQVVNKLDIGLPAAVACFGAPSTQETLVVCSDGFVARIATPRRPSKFP